MQWITYIMLAFAVVAGLDRIFGNRLKLGEEFERGVNMLAPLTLSMAGILVLAPLISHLLEGLAESFPKFLDFSIVPASILANDNGGAHLAKSLADNEAMGLYNGLVVGSMMGCTVSFTLPIIMQVTRKEHRREIFRGILCGIVTIPVGCILSGILLGLPILSVLVNLIPLILIAAVIAAGLFFFLRGTLRVLTGLGWLMTALITVGMVVGAVEFLTGFVILPYTDTLMNAMAIIVNIACIMMGAFPLLALVRRALGGSLARLGRGLGINDTAVFGFITTIGNSVPTFEMMERMDRRGRMLNAAFSVSAAFALVDHLAFTLSFAPAYVPAVLVGKFVSGVSAVALALLLDRRDDSGKKADA